MSNINQHITINVNALDEEAAAEYLRKHAHLIAEIVAKAAAECPGFARHLRGEEKP